MVSLHIPSFAPDGIFICIISFPLPLLAEGFLFKKKKGKKEEETDDA